jgi:hypothetical protein
MRQITFLRPALGEGFSADAHLKLRTNNISPWA